MKLNNKIAIALLASLTLANCTKLDEDLRSSLTEEQAQDVLSRITDVNVLLTSVYNSLRPFQGQEGVFALQQNTSDETVVPTRGGDWDDNGVWRVLTSHSWNADHRDVLSSFNNLLGTVFNATNVLTFNPSATQAAEARFVRAFAMYTVLDLYGQVPYREPGEDLRKAPTVLKGEEAINFIISEVNEVRSNLPDGPAYKANKDAARVLLMKMYLNKGAFLNRAQPTFAPADMVQVITLADEIINSGKYQLANNVFDNYAPNNDAISTENIFTNQNIGGVQGGGLNSRFNMGAHYNQKPGG
ncbi:MAG: RagB/SusD family nutrient uptake outer membrane protein, partial [Chitinophagaceae bacterium]